METSSGLRRQRPRRRVTRRRIRIYSPLLRYSYSRDAWVLRLVGRRYGPVFTVDQPVSQPEPEESVEARD